MNANFESFVKEVNDYKELEEMEKCVHNKLMTVQKENIKKANDLLKEIGKKIKEIEKLGCTVHSVYEVDEDGCVEAIHSEDDLYLM